jgi:hypothetical protein
MKIRVVLLFLTFFTSTTVFGQSTDWQQLRGPDGFFPVSTASPAPGVIISTTLKGIYKTEDGGSNWKKVLAPIPELENGLLASSDKGSLLIGSNNNAFYLLKPTPIYRSTDKGRTWTEVYKPSVCKLIVVINTNLIYALIQSASEFGGDYFQIIYSTNDGETWEENDQRVFLNSFIAEYDISFDSYGGIYHLDYDKINYSFDTGKSFVTISSFPYDSAHGFKRPSYVPVIQTDSVWYMTISGVPSISYNKGITWQQVDQLSKYSHRDNAPRFVVSRLGDMLLLTGNGKIVLLRKGSDKWEELDSFSDMRTLVDFDLQGNAYINTYLGLYAVSPSKDEMKYLGVPNSSPKFVCYTSDSTLFVYNSIKDDFEGPQYNYYGHLSYSRDNYKSLSYIKEYYHGARIWDHLSCLVVDTFSNTLVIGTGEGVVATSKDGGLNWEAVLGNYKVKDFQVYISGNGLYYAYSPSYALKLSKNQGSSWSEVTYWDSSTKSHKSDGFNSVLESSHGITFAGVYNKLYRKSSFDSVFVELTNIALSDKVRLLYETSLGDIFVVTEDNLIYISQDGGNTFVPSMQGMLSTNVTCIEEIGNGVVVAGVGNNMYFRRKTDSYWTPFPMASNLGEVISLEYKSNLGLYVGSRGNGLWLCENISDTITSSVELKRTSYFDAYIAPNPIVASSLIFLMNEKDTKVSLSVIDMNGKSISTPLLFNYSPSSNSVLFSSLCEKLPSAGQYYVSITSEYGSKIIPILIK